jgi:hypothetical protein
MSVMVRTGLGNWFTVALGRPLVDVLGIGENNMPTRGNGFPIPVAKAMAHG